MKSPKDVVGSLNADQRVQVRDLVKQAEDWLAEHDEFTVNVNETRATIAEVVWEHVVREAAEAGWDATFTGATVSIKRPR
jgi:wobble nucleotide-excising tRNase